MKVEFINRKPNRKNFLGLFFTNIYKKHLHINGMKVFLYQQISSVVIFERLLQPHPSVLYRLRSGNAEFHRFPARQLQRI